MLAARIHAFGPPGAIELEEVDCPIPAQDEVLVKVQAAGVGHWDALVRSGLSGLALSLPLTLGAEVAGTVAVPPTGPAASFETGEPVYGATNSLFTGGYAPYAICSAGMLADKPECLSHAEAASLPVAGVMAWQMVVEHAAVAAGDTVVVFGAAGNVGALAVQIALSRRARVIGTIRSDGDEKFVRGLGVSELLRDEDDFWRLEGSIDAIIDTVGGRSQSALYRLLRRGGILVSSVSPPDAALAAARQIRVDYFIVDVTTARLVAIKGLTENAQLRTHVGAVLTLRDARAAHEMLAGTRARPEGKIVLSAD